MAMFVDEGATEAHRQQCRRRRAVWRGVRVYRYFECCLSDLIFITGLTVKNVRLPLFPHMRESKTSVSRDI